MCVWRVWAAAVGPSERSVIRASGGRSVAQAKAAEEKAKKLNDALTRYKRADLAAKSQKVRQLAEPSH